MKILINERLSQSFLIIERLKVWFSLNIKTYNTCPVLIYCIYEYDYPELDNMTLFCFPSYPFSQIVCKKVEMNARNSKLRGDEVKAATYSIFHSQKKSNFKFMPVTIPSVRTVYASEWKALTCGKGRSGCGCHLPTLQPTNYVIIIIIIFIKS